MITINRKSVDKLLKEMDIFVHTKIAIESYKAEMDQLEIRGQKLAEKLAHIQSEHTENLLKLDGNTDVDAIINLKLNNVNLVTEGNVVTLLLEGLEEEKKDLKLKHVPLFREALRKDGTEKSKYDATPLVQSVRYELLESIADIGQEMRSQYREIAEDVNEVFQDSAVQEKYRNIRNSFEPEHYRPAFWEANQTVISKNDVLWATGGSIPQNIRKPEVTK